jgi:hypothetical protein
VARKSTSDDTAVDTSVDTPAPDAAPAAPAKPAGVRVCVITDLEPWIGDAPRKAGDLVDDVDPADAELMQKRGHVRILPS